MVSEVFRFGNPEYLYLLFLLPIIIFLFIFWRINRKKKLKKIGDSNLINQLILDESKYKPYIKLILNLLLITSLIIALANPQIGSKIEKVQRSGIEIMFALDVSNSMLAEDYQPNRLERAKQILNKFVDQLISDKVGLVVFAGDAFLQMPLTTDYSAAKLMISTSSTDLIGTQGTAIGKAIDICRASFSKDKTIHKVIVLITDGENHEDDALGSAKAAADEGIRIFTIGVGNPSGAPIPIRPGTNDFLRDSKGEVVITKMSPELLSSIASAGNGKFVSGNERYSELEKILKDISGIEKKAYEDMIYTEYDDKYYIFLWIAFALLIFDILIYEKKSPIFSKITFFEEK